MEVISHLSLPDGFHVIQMCPTSKSGQDGLELVGKSIVVVRDNSCFFFLLGMSLGPSDTTVSGPSSPSALKFSTICVSFESRWMITVNVGGHFKVVDNPCYVVGSLIEPLLVFAQNPLLALQFGCKLIFPFLDIELELFEPFSEQ
jgi:hypothetical protein